jgi:hypothetical protein
VTDGSETFGQAEQPFTKAPFNRLIAFASLSLFFRWRILVKKIALALAVCMMSGSAFAETCNEGAKAKNLHGAAFDSFMTKCQNDAKVACEADSKQKGYTGAAATSHTTKCTKDKIGTP